MFYYLFQYLHSLDFSGAGVFQYISFRTALATITSLLISIVYGKRLIRILQKKQIGEIVRDLGLEGQYQKKGTPTMGGILIIAAILIPTFLFAKLHNVYVILMIITTLWLGLIGFLDDYIKVFKKDKEGLSGRFKIYGQAGLGLIVGLTLYLNPNVVVREQVSAAQMKEIVKEVDHPDQPVDIVSRDVKSTKTTIPFVKNNEFDYSLLIGKTLSKKYPILVWIVFIILVIFIITAVSNGANMTDGLDGLATGTSAIIGATLGIFAYVSGNMVFANYLNIMYIPFTGELMVFAGAFLGATVGFLWHNSYPAQVFMGDTGSLTIGGIIAVFAILVRKELLIPILCGIFLMENISVLLQVVYFKYTKRRFGEGRRLFKMAPLHHHFQKLGVPESKIVVRFWIIGMILAILTIITLKIR